MVRGYEPGGEEHEFDPRSGNFFLYVRQFLPLHALDRSKEEPHITFDGIASGLL